MSHDDLPLFAWQPQCRVIPFPVKARLGRIRQTAQSLTSSRSEREAEHRWQKAVGSIRKSLLVAGVAETEIERHVSDFLLAVNAELVLIRSPWRLSPPEETDRGTA